MLDVVEGRAVDLGCVAFEPASGTYTVTLALTDKAGTSTIQVYTGRSMLRNGSSIARATHAIHVP